jgi:hypothetical protein
MSLAQKYDFSLESINTVREAAYSDDDDDMDMDREALPSRLDAHAAAEQTFVVAPPPNNQDFPPVIFPRGKGGARKDKRTAPPVVVTREVLETLFSVPLSKACKDLGSEWSLLFFSLRATLAAVPCCCHPSKNFAFWSVMRML